MSYGTGFGDEKAYHESSTYFINATAGLRTRVQTWGTLCERVARCQRRRDVRFSPRFLAAAVRRKIGEARQRQRPPSGFPGLAAPYNHLRDSGGAIGRGVSRPRPTAARISSASAKLAIMGREEARRRVGGESTDPSVSAGAASSRGSGIASAGRMQSRDRSGLIPRRHLLDGGAYVFRRRVGGDVRGLTGTARRKRPADVSPSSRPVAWTKASGPAGDSTSLDRPAVS
jgi:hypothetical protein